MNDYRVDIPGLQRLIDGAAALESAIENRIVEIEQRVDALHVDWTGEAAVAHKNAHDERVAAVSEMREALRELRGKLTVAHTAYGAVGRTNSGMWP